jgi:hypothetical protein
VRPGAAVLVLLVTACAARQSPAPARPLVGEYACRFHQRGFTYGWMPCAIRVSPSGGLAFEKLAGSQHVVGQVVPTGDGGFDLRGRFSCPAGDCDEAVSAHLSPSGPGGFAGKLGDEASTELEIAPASAVTPSALGGASYGGASYGGGSTLPADR